MGALRWPHALQAGAGGLGARLRRGRWTLRPLAAIRTRPGPLQVVHEAKRSRTALSGGRTGRPGSRLEHRIAFLLEFDQSWTAYLYAAGMTMP